MHVQIDVRGSVYVVWHARARLLTRPHARDARVSGGEGDVVRLRQPDGLAALPAELLEACLGEKVGWGGVGIG